MDKHATLLDAPIKEVLGLDPDFKAQAQRLGFGTLRDIINCNKKQLFEQEGFTMSWWNRLLTYFERHGMLNRLNG